MRKSLVGMGFQCVVLQKENNPNQCLPPGNVSRLSPFRTRLTFDSPYLLVGGQTPNYVKKYLDSPPVCQSALDKFSVVQKLCQLRRGVGVVIGSVSTPLRRFSASRPVLQQDAAHQGPRRPLVSSRGSDIAHAGPVATCKCYRSFVSPHGHPVSSDDLLISLAHCPGHSHPLSPYPTTHVLSLLVVVVEAALLFAFNNNRYTLLNWP